MFSSTNSSRPGVVSADSSARSYWPRTRWPMNPSSSPSWRVVTQRLASVMVALREARSLGKHLLEQAALELADERANAAVFARTQAAAVDDLDAVDDPGQLRAEMRGERRHDPGHRGGVVALHGAQLGRGQRPGRGAEAGDRDPLDPAPVDEARGARRPLDLAAGDGDRRPEHRADDEADLPQALVRDPAARPPPVGRPCERGRSGISRRLRAPRPRAARPRSTSGNDSPNIREAIDAEPARRRRS